MFHVMNMLMASMGHTQHKTLHLGMWQCTLQFPKYLWNNLIKPQKDKSQGQWHVYHYLDMEIEFDWIIWCIYVKYLNIWEHQFSF